MTKREITVQLPSDLEARPVALLVQVASQYQSEIHLESEGKTVSQCEEHYGHDDLRAHRR